MDGTMRPPPVQDHLLAVTPVGMLVHTRPSGWNMTREHAVRKSLIPLAVAFFVGLLAGPAGAASEHLGTHGSWEAWKSDDNGSTRCYVVSNPRKSAGKYTQRGKVYAFVEIHLDGQGADVVSFKTGYQFRKESTVNVEITDQGQFTLYTKDDSAWAYDKDDAALVAAMRKGFTMIVRGVSWRGTKTTDTYDLRGFSAASKAIRDACAG